MIRTESKMYIKQVDVTSNKQTFLYRITNVVYSILEKYNDILIFLSVIPNKKIKNDFPGYIHLDEKDHCAYGWWV